MSQADDLKAINDYFYRVTPVTPTAKKISDAWVPWYNALSWYERNMDSNVYNEARTRRNAFNLANAKTPEQEEAVKRVIATGLTTEEMSGKVIPLTSSEKKKILSSPIASGRATIRYGSTGPAVIEWQKVLGVTPDGKFFSKTKAATVAYQKAHGLVADGIVGPKTWATVPNTSNMVDSASRPLPNKEQILAATKSEPMPVLGGGIKNPRAETSTLLKKIAPKKKTPPKRKVRRPRRVVRAAKPKTVPKVSKKQVEQLKLPPTVKVREAGIVESFNSMPAWGKLGAIAAFLGIASATSEHFRKVALTPAEKRALERKREAEKLM